MMYVKADDESILSYGEADDDNIRNLYHLIYLLLFQGLVLMRYVRCCSEKINIHLVIVMTMMAFDQ